MAQKVSATPSISGEGASYGALLLLAGMAALCLLRPIATLMTSAILDVNEPWNVHFATMAMEGRNLYTPAGDYFDNYPPLSFYIVGAFGKILGSALIAGRVISLVAFAALSVEIIAAGRALGCTNRDSLFGALIFVISVAPFSAYVGMNDPQLMAQAIGMFGVVLVLRRPQHKGAIVSAAFLMTLALFMKQNLVAQPIAVLLWLASFDRRAALRFAACGILFALIGAGACISVFGTDFVSHVLTGRGWFFVRAVRRTSAWLSRGPIAVALAFALSLFSPQDKGLKFLMSYVVISILAAAILSGGTGVDVNIFFDADISIALSAALSLSRARTIANWRPFGTVFVAPRLGGLYVLSVALGIAFNTGELTTYTIQPLLSELAGNAPAIISPR